MGFSVAHIGTRSSGARATFAPLSWARARSAHLSRMPNSCYPDIMVLSRLSPVIFSAAALVVSGCTSLSGGDRARLIEGERAYHNADYNNAIEHMSAFIANAPENPSVARAYYVRGMACALDGRRASAYRDLRQAADAANTPDLRWRSHAVLGILHFEDGHWLDAANAFAAATENMSAKPPKDALLYRLGLCYERQGRWREARLPYRLIRTEFARGPYANLAERRLALSADHYAIQCGVFSKLKHAEQLRTDLKQRGLDTYVRQETRDGRPFFIVLHGKYQTYDAARQGLARARGFVPDAVLWP